MSSGARTRPALTSSAKMRKHAVGLVRWKQLHGNGVDIRLREVRLPVIGHRGATPSVDRGRNTRGVSDRQSQWR
jgi:hypothetical protein